MSALEPRDEAVAPNPYEAPRDLAPPPPPAGPREDGFVARYELTPADGGAVVAGQGSWALSIVGILLVLGAVATTTFALTPVGIVLVAWQPIRRAMAERAFGALREGQRRATARVHEGGLELRDEEGNVTKRLWSDLSATATATHLCFYQGPHAMVVPARGFASEDQFRAAAHLALQRAVNVRSPARLVRVGLVMWLFFIAVFVAIWSFFGAAPRTPAAAPSTSAS